MIPLGELIIKAEEFEAPALLTHWTSRIPQHFRTLFLSTFGDWFLLDGDEHVHMFDLVAGELKQVADSRAEFEALLELEEYRREWLMSHLVERLRQAGVERGRGQCFAFRTPPMLGGELSPGNVVVWDLAAYQAGTSKVHQQVKGLPPGTEVVIKPDDRK